MKVELQKTICEHARETEFESFRANVLTANTETRLSALLRLRPLLEVKPDRRHSAVALLASNVILLPLARLFGGSLNAAQDLAQAVVILKVALHRNPPLVQSVRACHLFINA